MKKSKPNKNKKLREPIAFDDGYFKSLHDEGFELLEKGEAKKGLPFFEKMLDYYLKNANTEKLAMKYLDLFLDAMYHKGEALSDLGRNKEALVTFNELLRYQPKDLDALFMKGYVLSDLKKDREAVSCYKKYLLSNPRDGDAIVNLSYSLMGLKKFKDAIRNAEKALKIDSSNYDALYNKAESLMNLGYYKEAVEAFNKVTRLLSSDDEAWFMKARCLAKLGPAYENKAIDALLVAISLNPSYRKKAQRESDFLSIRKLYRFRELVK